MSTKRSPDGALREHGTTTPGRYAVDLAEVTDVSLTRSEAANTDSRIAAQLDAADQFETGEARWGNQHLGYFSSLREMHTTCSATLDQLNAQHGEYDMDKFNDYPDRDLHRELSMRRSRIERGGPVWSWNSSSTDDVLVTVAVTDRNRTADRFDELADTQDDFVADMEAASNLDQKIHLVDHQASKIRFAGDANIAKVIKASATYQFDNRVHTRAAIAEARMDQSHPDHYTREDLDELHEETEAADAARQITLTAFEKAFEVAKSDIRASTDKVRHDAALLRDEDSAQKDLSSGLWSNGWPGDPAVIPEAPADFIETDLAGKLWAITESYR